MNKPEQLKFKKKHGRYCCDVPDCNNFAYAEMYRVGKNHGWCFVCRTHYNAKLRPATKKDMKERNIFRGKVPIEKDIGFCIIAKRRQRVKKK